MRKRVAVSLSIAVVAALIAWHRSKTGGLYDYTHYSTAGRALLAGCDPYPALVYPLPSAMYAALFAWLPDGIGGALFVGSAFGFLTWGLTRDGYGRLPILLSGPSIWCIISGQWTPLIVAAAITPAFAWAATAKPTLGLAAFLYRPSWTFVIVGGLAGALSLLLMPSWPWEWWAATRAGTGAKIWSIPIMQPFGFLLLLSALRWRTPNGRLLLAMSVVPQSMILYDQLPLCLLARDRRDAILFALWSQVIPLGVAYLAIPATLSAAQGTAVTFPFWSKVITYTMYFPALGVVLWRKE